MKHLIISPHLDDAIFSLGSYIRDLKQKGDVVTVLCPFGGIPRDKKGKLKYTKLLSEHLLACSKMDIKHITGKFLDDVYPETPDKMLVDWFDEYITGHDKIYVPLGIHHPDHIKIRSLFEKHYSFEYYYQELPYGLLYQEESLDLQKNVYESRDGDVKQGRIIDHNFYKEAGVRAYDSQIQNDHILGELFVEEKIWEL